MLELRAESQSGHICSPQLQPSTLHTTSGRVLPNTGLDHVMGQFCFQSQNWNSLIILQVELESKCYNDIPPGIGTGIENTWQSCSKWYTARALWWLRMCTTNQPIFCTLGIRILRILDMHKAQTRPLLYILFDISINILSFKNLNAPFDKTSIDAKKCPDIWKVTSSGRAKIENVKILSDTILNSACHQGVFLT